MRAKRETRALPGYAFVYHVGLSVPDFDAAVEFFTVVFGARELYRSSRRGEGRFMTQCRVGVIRCRRCGGRPSRPATWRPS